MFPLPSVVARSTTDLQRHNWKTFVIYGFGNRAERNCRLCPETARILATIPGLQNAWFSILTPGYHILPHRGVTKALIRCHLALLVPQQAEQCWIRVGDQRRHWEEGKMHGVRRYL